MIDRRQQEDLHRRLLADDPAAASEACRLFQPYLIEQLKARYPGLVDETLYVDAATDALFAYVQRPSAFDPSRRSLAGYLGMAAHGDLLNALEQRDRRRAREVVVDPVELRAWARNREGERGAERVPVDDDALLARVEALLADPKDRAMLRLMLDRERDSSAYARVLGLADLPPDEQRRAVKRAKDRLRKHIQRHWRTQNAP